MSAEELIRIENLRVSFGGREVVHGVSLSVDAGRTVGLVGESGSGKTVTGKVLMGMLGQQNVRATADRFDFAGRSLLDAKGRVVQQPRTGIAMIYQNPFTSLNPTMTVGAILTEALRRNRRLRRGDARVQALDLLRAVRIPEPEIKMRSYPHQLSGGQQQRVVIALALGLDADLIVADEPTTALDVTVQAEVVGLLEDLQRESGVAYLFISHDLSLVSDVASFIAVMRAGEIVETGGPELMQGAATHPYTRRLIAASPDVSVKKSIAELSGQEVGL